MSAPLRMTLAAMAVLGLSSCGSDNPTAAVRAKVQQFAAATRGHDYATICKQVLAPSLVAHLSATGVSCEQAWQLGLGSVTNPTLSIGQIKVKGSNASVIVLALAQNQSAALDTIELIKTSGGWRILSLITPGGGQ